MDNDNIAQQTRRGDDPPLEAEDLPDYDWSKPIEPQLEAIRQKQSQGQQPPTPPAQPKS